ncbi:MAG: hypothetical protein KIB50_02235 [Ureaplasma parvum]|uniref:Uncharacterized protein n=1 Tax=Ureaplasma parvum TaxID=134821 RepID=A0AAC9X6U0_UREPR|nr:hypothetical protein [Ureaplasma parvum]ASD24383.1 hypothetical protein CEG38_00450 [Ureaplasma parvum]ASD28757.1 hypothetical protein CEG40_00965 [Ureaplasma parvum]ASD29581.1 hypothetical protein CEG41_02840 [Ureaplasma parvum]ASD29976.1 hypothetical protein CEG42_01875 [Ureaplasma parvum]EDU19059.1 conserved hypothetical protein [Ureaplasma parvum serovar 6 str. ATCC 27818]
MSNIDVKTNFWKLNQKNKKILFRVLGYSSLSVTIITPLIYKISYNKQYSFITKSIRELKTIDTNFVSSYSDFYIPQKSSISNDLYNYNLINNYHDFEKLIKNDLNFDKYNSALIYEKIKVSLLEKYNENFFKNNDLLYVSYNSLDSKYFLTSILSFDYNNLYLPFLNTKSIFNNEYDNKNFYTDSALSTTKTEVKFFSINKKYNIKLKQIKIYSIETAKDLFLYKNYVRKNNKPI